MRLDILSVVSGLWPSHRQNWEHCTRCRIGELAFKHVFARGMLPCDFLYIGEAPGDTEDVTGFPFAGKAGKVMDRMLTVLPHHIWAITNVVLCKPQDGPGQKFREPTQKEKDNCRPRLEYFINEIAKPKGIICLGEHASRSAPFDLPMPGGDLRAKIPHICARHPAYIMYNGGPDSERGGKIFAEEVHKIADFIQEIQGPQTHTL